MQPPSSLEDLKQFEENRTNAYTQRICDFLRRWLKAENR